MAGGLYPFLGRAQDSARGATVITALLLTLVAWQLWPVLRNMRAKAELATLLAVSLLPALWLGYSDGQTAAIIAGGQVLLGWTLAGWLFVNRERAQDAARAAVGGASPSRAHIALLVAVAFCIPAASLAYNAGRWIIGGDDAIYLLQAHWMREPSFGWTVPEALRPHFMMRKLDIGPAGQFFGQYPPGWPAVIAFFDLLGLHWLTLPVLGAVSALATFRIGRLLFDARTGLLAAVLLIANAMWIMQFGTWMASALNLTCALLTAMWLLEAEQAQGVGRRLRWCAAGFTIALMAATRPLDGAAMAVTFGLWTIARGTLSPKDIAQCLATSLVGALPVVVALLYYHKTSNGEATRFAYEVINRGGNGLFWGQRGVTGLDSTATRVPQFWEFTPAISMRILMRRIAAINLTVAPYALLFPLLLFMRRAGHTVRWRILGCFLVLPTLYSVYWSGALRHLFVLLPFVLIWLAAGIERIRRREPQFAGLLTTAMVVGSLSLLLPGRWLRMPIEEPYGENNYVNKGVLVQTYEHLERLRDKHGPLLVIVKERGPYFDILLDRLYQFNMGGLDGGILVVRDLGVQNARAMAAFPTRTVVTLTDHDRDRPKDIVVLGRGRELVAAQQASAAP